MFKARKENLELRKQVLDLTEDLSKLKENHARVMAERQEQLNRADTLSRELTKTKKTLREQTEADLLVNALKALKIIPDDIPIDHFAESARLQHQLSAYNQGVAKMAQSTSPLGLAGGAGNMFGL